MNVQGSGGRRIRHDRRVFLLALSAGLPGTLLGLGLLWTMAVPAEIRLPLTAVVVVSWIWLASAVRARVVYPLQTLSNVLAALRDEDFSVRARGAVSLDPLGQLAAEVNRLGEMLREQRLGALEAAALMRTVLAEIPVAVFAFDAGRRVRLVNRAGERLLGRVSERILGESVDALGLTACLAPDAPRVLTATFPGGQGPWELRHARIRQGGLPLELLVMADVRHALREEERRAWQRLIRVLGHEINNSLAPIKSIAGSLARLAGRQPRPTDWESDLRSGLDVIAARAESLGRFTTAYAQLARLPPPSPAPVPIAEVVGRVAALQFGGPVHCAGGPPVRVLADTPQLEQLLINLLRNAVEAARETAGEVRIGWEQEDGQLRLWVDDEGPGIANPSNLFVPFFTTKPDGSGIGLVLSRQIAEAHGGTLTLQNRTPGPGARAVVRLPVESGS